MNTVAKALVVFAACAAVQAQAGYTAYDYKGRDAITMQWDGIDNQGTGSYVPHATTWKDLTVGAEATLRTDAANFADADNALTCVSRTTGVAASCDDSRFSSLKRSFKSVEFVVDPAVGKSEKTMVLYGCSTGDYNTYRNIILGTGGSVGYSSFASKNCAVDAWDQGIRNISSVFGNTTFLDFTLVNGTRTTFESKGFGLWNLSSGALTIGAIRQGGQTDETATYPFIGKIHALRFYSRQLTEAEALWNTHMDESRFNYGGNVHVLGFPEEYGTPSPAYGSSTQSGATLEFSPGPLQTYEDGMKGVPVSDGVRVCCLGYVLNGDVTTTNAVPTTALTLTDGMTVAWIWEKQVLITVSATAECPSVTLNGTSGAGVSTWIKEGSAVTVTSSPTDATKVVAAWSGATAGATISPLENTLNLTASTPCTLKPMAVVRAQLRFWRGSNTSAATAANWQDADGATGLPVAGDTVIFDSGSSQAITWTLSDVELGNWVQCGYTGTVTFKTGPGGTSQGQVQTVYGVLDESTGGRYLKLTGHLFFQSGSWTHEKQPSFSSTDASFKSGNGIYRIDVRASGDVEIGAGATVLLENCGFNSTGPTEWMYGSGGIRGGSHGGRGGGGPLCWGNVYHPVSLGGGGPNSYGAGAISIEAGGALTLDGTLSANARSNVGSFYTGAGGSVYLKASTISGSGTISADGGIANGGCGGGGRIALCLTGAGADFSSFSGTVTAYSGSYDASTAAGTIYRETAATTGNGELTVCGRGVLPYRHVETELPKIDRDYTFSKVSLLNGARLGIVSNTVVKIDALETESKAMSGLALLGGTVRLPTDFEFSDITLSVLMSGSRLLRGTGDTFGLLTVVPSMDFVCDAPFAIDAFTVAEGATAMCTKNYNGNILTSGLDRYSKFELTVTGDVTVASGATIDVNAAGYMKYVGSGAQASCGGSYGGLAKGADEGKCYGSITHPTDFGSGGCYDSSVAGGAVRLTCGGTLTVNGTIDAGATSEFYGGGSGGSILLQAAELAGAGVIKANGGFCGFDQRGGGGRVAIHLTKEGATFDGFREAGGAIQAYGGIANSAPQAGAGTVYLATVSGGVTNGTLIVDNGNATLTDDKLTVISPNCSDTVVDHVLVTNAAKLVIAQDGMLSVRGTFDTHGLFAATAGDADHAAGTVAFVDATREGLVLGQNVFQNFVCTTPGKAIRFGTGAEETLTRIAAGGKFTVTGDETAKVLLRSVTEGVRWPLDVQSGAGADVSFADVKDSDAAIYGGIGISATDSKDSGNNENWSFSSIVIGETLTWLGTSDGSWGNIANWDKGRAPVDTDVIVISADAANMPTLAEATVLNTLTVEKGASLALGGFALTVTNATTVAGSLVCSGAEALTLAGDVALSGTFTAAGSTVTLTGDGAATFNPGGNAFNRLVVVRTGSLAITDGLTADIFLCEPTAALALAFADGKTVTAGEFRVYGAAERMISLASATAGTRWFAKVSRIESVHGVTVRDAEATGLEIYADAPSTDSGNNAKWHFDGTAARWIGASSGGKFSDGANWSTGAKPGTKTRVVFDSDVRIELDEPATVREIVAESGTTVIPQGTNVLTMLNALVIESDATLSLDVVTVVSNSATIYSGGVLTHEAVAEKNLAHTNRVDLTVVGDMVIAAGGRLSATGAGFTSYYIGLDPTAGGPAHGGLGNEGSHCYGSIFEPTEPGSIGYNENDMRSGGVIRLRVGGTLTVNGTVEADGYNLTGPYRAVSGGSVWIDAAHLAGSGRISADASYVTSAAVYPAGGGRVAVYVDGGDFSSFTGLITAYGTHHYNPNSGVHGKPVSGAGTVYLAATEKPRAGTVLVSNDATDASLDYLTYTEIPAVRQGDAAEDFEDVTLIARNRAAISYTADLTLAELEYSASPVWVKLNDHTVRVLSMAHRRGRGWVDRETEDLGPNGLGKYDIRAPGLMLIVR